ncbi:MAG: acyltransferase, partial [Acidobacteriota bacterium]|nr:acyltransferase [Acidobacteriota bacterium]
PIPMLWVGVDQFFILSGFLITGILLQSKAERPGAYFRRFYSRRALRILPAYFVLLALVTLVFRVDWSGKWYWYAFFLQNFAVAFEGPQSFLNPLWSLAVEEQFYLVWPLFVYFFDRKALMKILVAMLVAAPALRALFTPLVPRFETIFCLTPFRMDLLAAGSLIAIYWADDRERAMQWNGAAGRLALATGLLFMGLALALPSFRAKANSESFNILGYSLSVACFSAVLIFVLTLQDGLIYRLLRSQVLVYLGIISYMMYMAHDPILVLVHGVGSLSRSLAALMATIGFASITWWLIEKPILRRGAQTGGGPERQAIRVATQTT